MIAETIYGWLDKVFRQAGLLQRVYGYGNLAQAKRALEHKEYYRAADCFCKAARRIRIDTASREIARNNFKAFFQSNDGTPALQDFLRTDNAAQLRKRFLSRPFPENIIFGGNLIPLKAFNPQNGEKGVLLLAYNYIFEAFHAVFQTEKLRDFYSLVLEPSYTNIEDPSYTLFRGWDIVVEARIPCVRDGIRWLGNVFPTVNLNAGDWVDSDTFYPEKGVNKDYDLIYVASYARYKRHELLFRTLAEIGRPLRVALVGFPFERTRKYIEGQMKHYGVADRCEIFERLPFEELNRLYNRSRVNLMISSHLESANRALYEAMYADVPSVVNRDCEGIDLSYVNQHTGVQASDDKLADAIMETLDRPDEFSPRDWALRHTHYLLSTRIVNEKLKELSRAKGEPWTSDIAVKVNRCDPVYKRTDTAERLRPSLDHLAQFIRS